jgi:hypothetical protein
VIPAQQQESLEVQVRTAQPGGVRVSARALPQGQLSEKRFTFKAPEPATVVFEELPLSIPVSGEALLRIYVGDQDTIFLRPASKSWVVFAKASNNADAIELKPERVVLSGQTPIGEVFMKVTGMPLNEELLVRASVEDGSLRTAEKKLNVDSHVARLNVLMPLEVNVGASTRVKAQFLLKGQDREAATEFQRKVNFSSDSGNFEPEEVLVGTGGTSASSMFVSHQPGQANLHISTPGVDILEVTVLVMVALGQLALMAFGAGTIDGLVRSFYYREESPYIWPHKTSRGWHPGVAGNAAFSGVFGVIMLLMTRYGLVHPLLDPQHLRAFSVALVHTTSGAFLLGIAGGFAGVGVLELLAKRLGLADALVLREKRNRDRPFRPVGGILHKTQ